MPTVPEEILARLAAMYPALQRVDIAAAILRGGPDEGTIARELERLHADRVRLAACAKPR